MTKVYYIGLDVHKDFAAHLKTQPGFLDVPRWQ
jgi:hypothetical protein